MTNSNVSPVSVFNFQSSEIRTVLRDGEPWFVASDICKALGYLNSRKAIADHLDDDEKGVTTGYTLGGNQKLTIISESGLYALVLRSRKPEARKFAKWVTAEVLPTIRKTGSYSAPSADAGELAKNAVGRGRFLLWFDDEAKPQMMPIDDYGCVVRARDEVSVMTFIREYLPLNLIPVAIEACAKRLVSSGARKAS